MTSTTPSLATAAADLRDATDELETALSEWWRNPEADVSAASEKWWLARKAFHEAILTPVESRAS